MNAKEAKKRTFKQFDQKVDQQIAMQKIAMAVAYGKFSVKMKLDDSIRIWLSEQGYAVIFCHRYKNDCIYEVRWQ